MKIKLYIKFLLTIVFLFCSSFSIEAQEGSTTFVDGITVAIKTEAKPPIPEGSAFRVPTFETHSTLNGKNIIHRVMTDVKNKLYFGYDIEVSALTDNKFKVAFKPLSINPNKLAKVENLTAFPLSKYPEEMTVADGDIISFDTLENPQTKARLSDLIKVTRESKMWGSYFAEPKPAKDFTIDDVQLQATQLEAFINDKKVGQVRGIAGSFLTFYFQDKGQFKFSLFPKSGFNFQKIGVIEDNKLTFTYNGDSYKFVSSSPFVGTGGKWNVWILHNPDYKPTLKSPVEFGAGDF